MASDAASTASGAGPLKILALGERTRFSAMVWGKDELPRHSAHQALNVRAHSPLFRICLWSRAIYAPSHDAIRRALAPQAPCPLNHILLQVPVDGGEAEYAGACERLSARAGKHIIKRLLLTRSPYQDDGCGDDVGHRFRGRVPGALLVPAALACALVVAAAGIQLVGHSRLQGAIVLQSRVPPARGASSHAWQSLAASKAGGGGGGEEDGEDEDSVIRFENDNRVGGGDLMVPVGMIDYENLGQGSIVDQRYPRKLPGQDELEAEMLVCPCRGSPLKPSTSSLARHRGTCSPYPSVLLLAYR